LLLVVLVVVVGRRVEVGLGVVVLEGVDDLDFSHCKSSSGSSGCMSAAVMLFKPSGAARMA
jgi:hypothetical protein